jgi:hypothetical protein
MEMWYKQLNTCLGDYRKEVLGKRLLLPGDFPAYSSLSLDRKAVHR